VYVTLQSDLIEIPLPDLFRKGRKLITFRLYRISPKKVIELIEERMPAIQPMITPRVGT
jgi:hypothetical protein